MIHGRDSVVPDAVKLLTPEVLAHRIILNIEDTLEGLRSEFAANEILSEVPASTGIREAAPQ